MKIDGALVFTIKNRYVPTDCLECKWCAIVEYRRFFIFKRNAAMCGCKQATGKAIWNYATRGMIYIRYRCTTMRNDEMLCGQEAEYFEKATE
jgi:hypothetical protein